MSTSSSSSSSLHTSDPSSSSSSSSSSVTPDKLILFVNGMDPGWDNLRSADTKSEQMAAWKKLIEAASGQTCQCVYNPAAWRITLEHWVKISFESVDKHHEQLRNSINELVARTNEHLFGTPTRTAETPLIKDRRVTWFLHSYGTTVARFALAQLDRSGLPLRLVGVGEVLWGSEDHGQDRNKYNKSVARDAIFNFRDARDHIAAGHNAVYNPKGAFSGAEPLVTLTMTLDLDVPGDPFQQLQTRVQRIAQVSFWWAQMIDQNRVHSLTEYLAWEQVIQELKK